MENVLAVIAVGLIFAAVAWIGNKILDHFEDE